MEESLRREEKEESIGTAHLVRPSESPRPLLSSLMEDEEGSSSSRFNKYKQFSVRNKPQQDDDTRVESQNFAFGKRIDNRTIVPSLDQNNCENKRNGDSSDLNFIDKAAFGSAYTAFNPSEANIPRQVTVDPSVMVARQASVDPDLNLVDKEYFAPTLDHSSSHHPNQCQAYSPSQCEESDSSKRDIRGSSESSQTHEPISDELGFIDEQFFQPMQTSPPSSLDSEKTQKHQLKDDAQQSHSKQQSSQPTLKSPPMVKSGGGKWFQTELDLPEDPTKGSKGVCEPTDLLKYSERLELEQGAIPTLQSEEKYEEKASESFEIQKIAREDLKANMSEKRRAKKKAKSEAGVKDEIFEEKSASSKKGKSSSVLEELKSANFEDNPEPPPPDRMEPKKGRKKEKGDHKKPGSGGAALEYVRKLRKMEEQANTAPVFPLGTNLQDRLMAATTHLKPTARLRGSVEEEEEGSKSKELYHVKRYSPPKLATYTSLEMQELLASKVIYNKHDIVALWKPYGMTMFNTPGQQPLTTGKRGKEKKDEVTGKLLAIETYLPFLADKLGCNALHEVHRLDATTTGVLLIAKTTAMRDTLKKLFAQRKVEKTYLAITNGVPKAAEGIIDIPVGEGKIGERFRMTLRPDYSREKSRAITNKKTSQRDSLEAVTEYKVLSNFNSAALVQCNMSTGRKHQIRLHLGLGLGTPILGDHKYSYPDILDKPQRVKGDIVARLRVQPSKTRDLPLFLHARRILIPGILPENDLVITANLPHFMSKTMKKLRLKADRNAEKMDRKIS